MNTQDTSNTLERLAGEADTAISKAARHLKDQGLSDLGKQEKIDAELNAVRERLEGNVTTYEERFKDERARAQAVLSAIPVPSSDELAALGYTRDVLRVRFKAQKSAEIYKAFAAALEGSDLTLIRAYMLEAPRAGDKPSDSSDPTPGLIRGLIPKAEEKLRTPEQREAAKLLAWLDKDGNYKLSQLKLAVAKLKSAKVQRGQLVTAMAGYVPMGW